MSTSQAQSQVPDEIKTLGQPLAIHTGKRNLGMFVLVIAGCCFAALLILLVGLISGGVKPGPGRAIAPVLMLLMGIGGTYLIFTAIRIRNMVYYLCPGGIARQTPGRVEIIPWEGLEVYQRAETHPFGGTNRYWLVHGETKWKLTWDVTEIDAMGKAIAEEMRRRCLGSMGANRGHLSGWNSDDGRYQTGDADLAKVGESEKCMGANQGRRHPQL